LFRGAELPDTFYSIAYINHSIPRLELCAAVLAVEVAQFALEQLDLEIDNVKFYTDSKVVLGYISNEAAIAFSEASENT
jgi:ribonuclease HI